MASKPTTQDRIHAIRMAIASLKAELHYWDARLEWLKDKAYEPEDSLER